jgi:hypothetical protein
MPWIRDTALAVAGFKPLTTPVRSSERRRSVAARVRISVGSMALVFLAACTSARSPVSSPPALLSTASAAPQPSSSPATASRIAVPSSSSTDAPPSAAPTPIPLLTATFSSPTMGYSVRYPANWTVSPATALWLPASPNFWDDPVGDRLEGDNAGFRGTSQALAKGQTADSWLKDYFGSGPSCGDHEQVPVGNQFGTIGLNGCGGLGRLGGLVFDLALVVGGRGYDFTMEGAVDHRFFLAMLATVTFSPKSATLPHAS